MLISSACIVVGLLWDISWHSTIGRDTFWSPPHLLEQLGAVVAGLSCGWLVLRTTFAGTPRAARRRRCVLGLLAVRSAPGSTIWGTFVMIASAPFDNWWHNAYGLDVKIVSPPHMVLALGMIADRARRHADGARGAEPRDRPGAESGSSAGPTPSRAASWSRWWPP